MAAQYRSQQPVARLSVALQSHGGNRHFLMAKTRRCLSQAGELGKLSGLPLWLSNPIDLTRSVFCFFAVLAVLERQKSVARAVLLSFMRVLIY
jgi:hypothetical protein